MDKKKVCIGIIIFLVIVIIGVNLARVFCTSKELQISDASNVINEDTENIISEDIEEDSITENEVTQESNTEVIEDDVIVEDKGEIVETPKEIAKNQENTKQTTSTIINQESKAVQEQSKSEQKQASTKEKINNTTKENTTQSSDNSSNTKEKEQQTKVEETYTVNNTMINQIIKTIQNNESEFMKKYGYTIQVDSSIKKYTNQFTFTENRVKSAITNKFGTIRIYAEDYYKNGQLIMTECYII